MPEKGARIVFRSMVAFGLGDVRFRLLLLGYRRIEVRTRNYARIQQLLHAGKVRSR